MIRIRNLRFQYGSGFQLTFDHLEVAQGERIAIVGRSGCGKTTLLNLIAGVQPHQQGEIEVAGQLIASLDEPARRRFRSQHIGFVFQELELIEYLNLRDNVLLPIRLQGRSTNTLEVQQRLQRLLEATDLQDRARHHPHQLSQGQRQRAALCRALITEPKVLLADEPTGSLDQQTASAALELLISEAQRLSATLLMVTHATDQLRHFDRVIQLDSVEAAS